MLRTRDGDLPPMLILPRLTWPHLVLDGLAVLGVADHRQLQLGHLLHLAIHVDLLQEAADLAPQEAHRVLLPQALGQQGGAGRVDGRHPVLQVRLVAGLRGAEGGGDGGEGEADLEADRWLVEPRRDS